MKVIDVHDITREDGTEYAKIEFDTKHTAVLNRGEYRFKFFTPKGRTATDDVAYRAVKAINAYYDQL
jgi:hypothetical protein